MSLIATLFTNSCADGALVPAGWARATEANRQQPTVISSDLFMICTPGSCGSHAARLTNLAVPFLFRGMGPGNTIGRSNPPIRPPPLGFAAHQKARSGVGEVHLGTSDFRPAEARDPALGV
jgi:hypothetical protein